jgi:ankyrin repeat protein
MVSYGANVDAVDNYGLTPLHRAAVGEKDCPEPKRSFRDCEVDGVSWS